VPRCREDSAAGLPLALPVLRPLGL